MSGTDASARVFMKLVEESVVVGRCKVESSDESSEVLDAASSYRLSAFTIE